MKTAFRTLLLQASAVTAIAGQRINWGENPQGHPLPSVVLMAVDDDELLTLDGPNGLSQGRVQVDCYAETYKPVSDLAAAVRLRLAGYRGGNFRLIEHVATRDSREGGTNEADRPFRISMDFITHWRTT